MAAMFTRLSYVAVAALLASTSFSSAHGSFHEMMEELALELKARPEDSTLYVRRTRMYLEHEDWKAALIDIEHAERLGSDTSELDLLRAQALAQGGMLAQAEALLADYLQSHAENGASLRTHARVLAKMERTEESLKAYRNALRRTADPEPDLYQEVAEALAAQKQHAEALEVLQLGIARRGNVPSLVIKAMEWEMAAGRYDEALKRIDAMELQAPRPEPWMAKRAELLTRAGRTGDARDAWTALRDRILALPNLERGSHAISLILEETQNALAVLATTQSQTVSTAP
jgi:tetratricopeptide (TPR) repeat protein